MRLNPGYLLKSFLLYLKDQNFISAQKVDFHLSSAANKSKLANFWNKTFCYNAYKFCILLQQNMFVVKGRYLSKPSRLFMVHGDAHICILTYYFKNEMLGAQKNTCAREEYHLFRVLQQKRKLFCILHFFFPTL